MKKILLLWLLYVFGLHYFGEYVISRPFPGILQAILSIGMIASLIYLVLETFKLLTKKEEKK